MLKPEQEAELDQDPVGFQKAIVAWYEEHAAAHPWRKTRDPYAILVSEVMLQQTTIQSVLEQKRYEKFMAEFPTAAALAEASEAQILRAWEGLGYYNRVRNLQKAAQRVLLDHEGVMPETLAGLESLPGIGRYTAAAVYCFAYGLSAPLVDANVLRLFSRLYNDPEPINSPLGGKKAWKRASDLVPSENAREYNGGLMELGQRVCRQKEAACLECPVAQYCRCTEPLSLPKKLKKVAREFVTEHAIWARRPQQLLLEKETGTRRKGFWRLPLRRPEGLKMAQELHRSKYAITKYEVTLHVYEVPEMEPEPQGHEQWVELASLPDLPIVSPVRKVIEALLSC